MFGEFSMVVVHANEDMITKLTVGYKAIFVGIYDSIIAPKFLSDSLFSTLLYHIDRNCDNVSEDILREIIDI